MPVCLIPIARGRQLLLAASLFANLLCAALAAGQSLPPPQSGSTPVGSGLKASADAGQLRTAALDSIAADRTSVGAQAAEWQGLTDDPGPTADWSSSCRGQFNLWYLNNVNTYQYFQGWQLLDDWQITAKGWLDAGILGNDQNPASNFNGPVTMADRDKGQFNQKYGIIERIAPCDNCGWFLGGRMDMIYGSDYFFTTAAGLDGKPAGNLPRWRDANFRYGMSMPQLYAEVAKGDLRVKLGHFYTIIGNESAMSPNNFFYTHSYAFQYGQPITQTGVLASRPVNSNWNWAAGIVGGWNNFAGSERPNFLGGLSYSGEALGTLALALVTGDDSTLNRPGLGPLANRTMLNLVWARNLGACLNYLFQYDYGVQDQAATLAGPAAAHWYGINQQLIYTLSQSLTAGARLEWFRDSDGFVVTGLRPSNPLVGSSFSGDFYDISLGLNYTPVASLLIRPELRYDWFQASSAAGSQFPFGDNTSTHQFLYGLDLIYQF